MKYIELTKGYQAIVDDEDYEELSQYKWHYTGGYARRAKYLGGGAANPKLDRVRMHRQIMNAPKGVFVDHINGNTLDNRKSNLRLATESQNGANRGANNGKKSNPYKGVYRLTSPRAVKKWWALIVESSTGVKKRRSLGVYATPEEAAQAYNEAALKYFGEFAYLNDIS